MARRIVIAREFTLTGALGNVDVFLDGAKIGTVPGTDPVTFEIPEGYHIMYCKTGIGPFGTKSNDAVIDDDTNYTIYYKVNLKKGFYGSTFNLYSEKIEAPNGQVLAEYDPRMDQQAVALAQKIARDFMPGGFFHDYILPYNHAINLGIKCEGENIKVMWNAGPEVPRNVPVHKDPIGAFNWVYYKLWRKMDKENREAMEELIYQELSVIPEITMKDKLFDIRLTRNEKRFGFGW